MIPAWYLPTNFLTSIYALQRAALWRYGLRQVGVVAPADEPVSLEDAQRHLDVDTYDSPPASDFDAWITAHIPAAREYCEQYAGVTFAARTMELASASFPTDFVLPFGPVQSITSILYLDDLAAEQTVDPANYVLDVYSRPSRVILAYGQSWPTAVTGAAGSVRVRYVTGYSHPDDSPVIEALPAMARAAILEMLRHLFDHPGDEDVEIPRGVKALLDLLPGGRERLGMA